MSIFKKAKIGYIKEGVTSIGNEHLEKGIILFYDDIPRMNRYALQSIIKNRVKGIIATGRTEEIALLRRITGIDLYEYFRPIRLAPLSDDKIREMLMKYLEKENVGIADREAIDEVVKKAQGLPVYVWQVVRELKIRKQPLSLPFARSIPQGMLDYVDDILWRILGGKPERYEALLALLCMTDLTKYAVHQDLYNYIYLIAKEMRLKKRLTLGDILTDAVIEDISRYLAREGATYSFRLLHDSWADVLKGRSTGPMSSEIAKISSYFTKEKRASIILKAARRAYWETLKSLGDPFRLETFKNNIRINLGETALKDIMEKPPVIEEKAEKPIEERVIEKPARPAPIIGVNPMDTLKGIIASGRIVPIKAVQQQMHQIHKTSESDLRNLLDIADFVVFSRRKGFLIYKDHYISALRRAEELLSKMGVMDIKTLATSINLFPEDIKEGLKDKIIIHENRIAHRGYLARTIKSIIETRGFINLEELSKNYGIPTEKLLEIAEKIEGTTKSATPNIIYNKAHYVRGIGNAKRILQQKGIAELRELSRQLAIAIKDLERELADIAIIWREKAYNKEHIWTMILRKITTEGKICLDKLTIPPEVAGVFSEQLEKIAIRQPNTQCYYHKEHTRKQLIQKLTTEGILCLDMLDIPRQIAERFDQELRKKAVRPLNSSCYFTKQYMEKIASEITEDLSIWEASEKYGLDPATLEFILKETEKEKTYATARLRKILKTKRATIDEIRALIRILQLHRLNKEELNVLGVACLTIWERTGDESDFSRGIKVLEIAGTSKAKRNIAIAYAKYAKKILREQGYEEAKTYAEKAMKIIR